MDSCTSQAWQLTCQLVVAADSITASDPVAIARAHAGAAVLLFSRFDPLTAERLAQAISGHDEKQNGDRLAPVTVLC